MPASFGTTYPPRNGHCLMRNGLPKPNDGRSSTTKDECRRPLGRKYKLGLDGGPGLMDKLLVAEAAEDEYTDSLRWYAKRSIRTAERFEAEFEKALEAIAAHPERRRPWLRNRPSPAFVRPSGQIATRWFTSSSSARRMLRWGMPGALAPCRRSALLLDRRGGNGTGNGIQQVGLVESGAVHAPGRRMSHSLRLAVASPCRLVGDRQSTAD